MSDTNQRRAGRTATREPLLHLASASPRRHEILQAIGVEHTFAGVGIDETPLPDEGVADLVLRLAVGKAMASRALGSGAPLILGADTIVSLDGQAFGKPGSKEEALYMLSRLSGRVHTVQTAVALLAGDRKLSAVSSSEVQFREIHAGEALAYWHTGEPSDKAGAYAIQGRGGIFVASIRGSFSCIVGLPVFETASLLKRAGIEILGVPED